MLNKVYVLLVNQSVHFYLFINKYCNLLQQCGYNRDWSESSGRVEIVLFDIFEWTIPVIVAMREFLDHEEIILNPL